MFPSFTAAARQSRLVSGALLLNRNLSDAGGVAGDAGDARVTSALAVLVLATMAAAASSFLGIQSHQIQRHAVVRSHELASDHLNGTWRFVLSLLLHCLLLMRFCLLTLGLCDALRDGHGVLAHDRLAQNALRVEVTWRKLVGWSHRWNRARLGLVVQKWQFLSLVLVFRCLLKNREYFLKKFAILWPVTETVFDRRRVVVDCKLA